MVADCDVLVVGYGPVGQLSPQGRVRTAAGTTGRFDQVVGTGFALLSGQPLGREMSDFDRALLAELGAHVVQVVPAGAEPAGEAVVDVDGLYLGWLRAAGYEAAVIRPDCYVFGGVASVADLPGLLAELFAKVGLRP